MGSYLLKLRKGVTQNMFDGWLLGHGTMFSFDTGYSLDTIKKSDDEYVLSLSKEGASEEEIRIEISRSFSSFFQVPRDLGKVVVE